MRMADAAGEATLDGAADALQVFLVGRRELYRLKELDRRIYSSLNFGSGSFSDNAEERIASVYLDVIEPVKQGIANEVAEAPTAEAAEEVLGRYFPSNIADDSPERYLRVSDFEKQWGKDDPWYTSDILRQIFEARSGVALAERKAREVAEGWWSERESNLLDSNRRVQVPDQVDAPTEREVQLALARSLERGLASASRTGPTTVVADFSDPGTLFLVQITAALSTSQARVIRVEDKGQVFAVTIRPNIKLQQRQQGPGLAQVVVAALNAAEADEVTFDFSLRSNGWYSSDAETYYKAIFATYQVPQRLDPEGYERLRK